MGYTDSLLASGERTVRIAHQHWFVLVWRARWAILAIIIAVVFGGLKVFNSSSSGTIWDILGWVTVGLLVIGILSFVWGLLTFRSEEFVITSRRIIHSEGVINKRATDSSLEKINDAVLTESLFGRIFGFGDLDVLTASESGIEHLKMLRDAKSFKKAMLEAKHELELELSRPTLPPVRAAEPVAPVAPVAPAPAPEPVPAPVAAAPAAFVATEPEPAPVPVAAAPGGDDAPTAAIDTAAEVTAALDRLGDLRDRGVITPEEFESKKAELLGRL